MFQGLKGKESVRNEAFAFPDDKHESLEGKDNKERKTWIEEGGEESVMQTELFDNCDFNLTTMIKLVLKEPLQQSQVRLLSLSPSVFESLNVIAIDAV
jgi:hypothetical protein